MELSRYLDRIGFHEPVAATADVLQKMQAAHLLSVPFENLSIGVGEEIVLAEGWLYEKIVTRRRGGFCYELNGLFAWALREMGFYVEMLSAGVCRPDGAWGPEFDHMTLVVGLEERWVVDVGFGDSSRKPLALDGGARNDGFGDYQIGCDEEGRRVLRRKDLSDGAWRDLYRFDLEPRVLGDYAEMCRWQQTSPDSFFAKGRLCSLALPDGRITISGDRLITTEDGVKTERELADEADYRAVLRERFGIVMPA